MFASDPPNAPMAERAALNTTTSLVISIFLVSFSKTIPLYRDPIIEINDTLQTFKSRSERLVWLWHFGKLGDSNQPVAGVEAGKTLDTAAIVKTGCGCLALWWSSSAESAAVRG